MALTAVITGVAFCELVRHPETIYAWKYALLTQHSNPWAIFGISLILFPRLALGLSGFETGVAVMPLIRGKDLAAAQCWDDIMQRSRVPAEKSKIVN